MIQGITWPEIEQACDMPPIVLRPYEEWAEEDNHRDTVFAITDGWASGPIGAILRGGMNARAVLEILARSGVKDIRIFHIEERIPQLEDIFLSTVVVPAHSLFESVTIVWRRDASLNQLIKSIGQDYSMLFFGAPLVPSETQPFYNQIKGGYGGSVTIVRGQASEIDIDEDDEISRWVRERTFDATDFSVPSVLRNFKKKLGKKITVVLPSLNEEKTIGNVIHTALEVKKVGLIDEVILVDSLSSDNTVAIARSYGIPVFIHPEVRPDLGSFRGKGEAMFKSAFVDDSDILAWVDTDIESITPRFFYGLLGPILTDPSIRFAKGYFARPVRVEASGVELGGGRVTELLARPWINAFAPRLSGYIQPLAGIVAIYRDALMKMKIPTNYGVEMAMLLQVVRSEGLWSTCQVNLGDVIHKSKDVNSLSEMAFQIFQVLGDLLPPEQGKKPHELLRRTYFSEGHFEIGIKRFRIVWRRFDGK
jgi:hypothetical protein